MMKKRFLLYMIPAMMAAVVSCGGKSVSSIHFDSVDHDFGKMKQNEVREHTFRFTNKGKGDLLIFSVVEGCGCTKSSVSDKIIRPGESGTLKVAFDAENFTGFQNKYVSVFSNDPDREKVRLRLLAEIEKKAP